MHKVVLEMAGTCHIAKFLETSETRPCIYVFEQDLLCYRQTSIGLVTNREVRFDATDREHRGCRVFREYVPPHTIEQRIIKR
jgi:hypothetical protein